MPTHPKCLFGYFIQPNASPVIDTDIILWFGFLISLVLIIYLLKPSSRTNRLKRFRYHLLLMQSNFWLLKTIYGFKHSYKKQRKVIDNIKHAITETETELSGAGNISEATDRLVKENIAYLQDQESFHLMLAYQIQIKILELEKRRREIFLLHTIINRGLKESNPGDHLREPIDRFYTLVSSPAKTIIMKWQKKLQTVSRKKDMEAAFNALQSPEFSL